MKKNDIKLYNFLAPFWMWAWLLPTMWAIILPGNFIIDSIVLIIGMFAVKMPDKVKAYWNHIFVVFGFGLLSDFLASAAMYAAMYITEKLGFSDVFSLGDELHLTIPGLLIAMALIFVFNYYITFRKLQKSSRFKLALMFAVITAPYTFLVPSSWLYH